MGKNYNKVYETKESIGRMVDKAYSTGYDDGVADKRDTYDKGFKFGKKVGYEEGLAAASIDKGAYEKGLNDAWEVQRIITHGLTDDEFREIFALKDRTHVCRAMSAAQAMAKIREYNDKLLEGTNGEPEEKSDDVKVGEMFIDCEGECFYITNVVDEHYANIMYTTGRVGYADPTKNVRTGKSVDLYGMFAQMKACEEESNE